MNDKMTRAALQAAHDEIVSLVESDLIPRKEVRFTLSMLKAARARALGGK